MILQRRGISCNYRTVSSSRFPYSVSRYKMALRCFVSKKVFNFARVVTHTDVSLRKYSTDVDGTIPESHEPDPQSETSQNFRRYWTNCVNEVKLLGYMGADAKLYSTERRPFIYFPLATEHYYKSTLNETHKTTVWHKILVKESQLVEMAKNLVKGSRIFISGRLTNQKLALSDEDSIGESLTCVLAKEIICLRRGHSTMYSSIQNETEN